MATVAEVKLGPAVFEGMLIQPVKILGDQKSIYETLQKVDSLIEHKLNTLRETCSKQAAWDLESEDGNPIDIAVSKKQPTINEVSELYSEINQIWERGNLLLKQLTVFKDQFDETAIPTSIIRDKASLEDTIIEIDRLLKVFKLNHLTETSTKDWKRKNITELNRDFVPFD